MTNYEAKVEECQISYLQGRHSEEKNRKPQAPMMSVFLESEQTLSEQNQPQNDDYLNADKDYQSHDGGFYC